MAQAAAASAIAAAQRAHDAELDLLFASSEEESPCPYSPISSASSGDDSSGDDSSDDESDSDTESDTDSDTDTDSDSDSGVSETEADDYARVVRVLAEDLADYQPPHKRVRFTIGTGMIPNSESNSCFRSIRVPSTPTSAN